MMCIIDTLSNLYLHISCIIDTKSNIQFEFAVLRIKFYFDVIYICIY